jgi:hypothetical protein
MCNDAACGGRLGSKREQYIVFYSSARFWIEHRDAILDDQLEIFRRGVEGVPRPNCCDDPRRESGIHGGSAQLDGRVPEGVPDPVRRRLVP